MNKPLSNLFLTLSLPLLCACAGNENSTQVDIDTFVNPPAENHIGTWWHWMNGHITREGITQDLEAMHAQGISHATILNVSRPFTLEYQKVQHLVAPENMHEIDEPWVNATFASDEWMSLFRFAVDEAARLGMYLGAANCDGWSESGGPWIKPEQSMKEFVYTVTEVEGGKSGQVILKQPESRLNYYRDAYVLAFPAGDSVIAPDQVKDITAQMDADGRLAWNAPEGKWKVLRFGFTTTGKENHPASPEGVGLECDKMDTTALNVHFASFPQRLIDAAGEHRGKAFRYFLVDSWEAGFQTWTDRMPEEFAKRRGYELTQWLPALCGFEVGCKADADAFRYDFQLTISDLTLDCYFKHLADLCHRQGIQLMSEGIYGSYKLPSVDVLKSYKYCDVPMTEFWAKLQAHHYPYPTTLKNPLNYVTPQHAAQLYNKPVVASEAYTGYALYSDAPFDLKLFGDQAYSEGVSQMVLHSYVHQMQDRAPGFTLGVYGQSFNRLNPWFNESRPFMDWQARQQYMLQGGVRVADALIYIGDTLPAYECGLEELQRLLPAGMKYQYINQDVLLSGRISVRDGSIWLDDDKQYRCIIVRHQGLDLSTMQQLEKMSQEGASVVGVKPRHTLRLTDRAAETEQLLAISDRMWGNTDFKPVPDIQPDLRFAALRDWTKVLVQHRRKGAQDIYFLVNAQDQDTLVDQVTFRQEAKTAILFDPMDGRCYNMRAESTGQGSTFRMQLRPKQSVFVVFGMSEESQKQCASYQSEVLAPQVERTLVINEAEGTVSFDSDTTLQPQSVSTFRSLTESANPDIRYYGGVLTYDLELDLPSAPLEAGCRALLQLPRFGCTATVSINGKDLGTIWDPYYQLDITSAVHSGSNQMTVRITTPLRNRIVGDLNQDRGERALFTTSPGVDKYDQVPYFSRNHELIPTGISKPMVVRFVK